MVSPKHVLIATTALLGLAAGEAALARTSYCCNDANGKLTCGDILPNACHARPYRVLDEKGRVVREVAAPLTSEQRMLRETEETAKREAEKQAAEEKRRNQALLATYPSEKDIDLARDRALEEFDKASSDTQKRFDAALKQQKKLDAEKEFYVKKPMPANLKRQVEDNANDIKTTQAALENRKHEANSLRAKYDEEKSRYMALRYGKSATPVAAPTAAADKRPR